MNKNKSKKRNRRKKSNKAILWSTYFIGAIFLALIVHFVKYNIYERDTIINNPYNNRQHILEEEIRRGDIVSDDGTVLATTVENEEGKYERYYPYANIFAHSVGYSKHGTTGIELMANYKLLSTNVSLVQTAINDFKNVKDPGNTVTTSLNLGLTQTAYNALGDYDGAVIVLDTKTGQILTMVSKPDFDPNVIDEIWDSLVADESNSNLVNRTTQGLYTPGSTFKLLCLLEYMHEHAGDFLNYYYQCESRIYHSGMTINCADGRAHGLESLEDSFANSCNCSFVNLGLTLDLARLEKLCNDLMFNEELPIDYSYNKSSYSLGTNPEVTAIMQTSIGQGETLMSPIHLAMIAAAIANDGIVMKPYVITGVKSASGKILDTYSPKEYKRILSAEDCENLKTFMRSVVTKGTGQKLMSDAYEAYGKTGTAQVKNGSQCNSLFMGFAKSEEASIAVCVVMEDMPENSTYAVPITKQIFDYYFANIAK